MNAIRQIVSVTTMNLIGLPKRGWSWLVVVIGIGGVTAVLVSTLAMGTGMIKTMERSGHDDRAIVMRNGSLSEVSSVLTRDVVKIIENSPGIKHDADGAPIVSAELFRTIRVRLKDDNSEVNASFRGVGSKGFLVRPELKIIEGRMFRPAVNEVIVGRSAKSQFSNLEVGKQIVTRSATWTIVGVFVCDGGSQESELMTDAETLMSTAKRNNFSSVTALLESKDTFAGLRDSLTGNPAVAVDILRESEYFSRQSKASTQLLSVVAYVIGGIMALGAVLGALNTMYAAVGTRAREIATLRALGFGPAAMIISVLTESLLLALLGGITGAVLAWIFFNGNTVSTGASGSAGSIQLVFDIAVTSRLVIVSIVWATCIGIIGGIFPAVRAARLPVAAALRAI